ncbi:MAG: IS21 family transposase [Planctomycetota bacterium]|jgi:transposase InsO family protein
MLALVEREQSLAKAAAKAGIGVKAARKYRRLAKLPSEVAPAHTWRTRENPFDDVWDWCREQLELNPGLQAKTLFAALQRQYPGRFQDGQLRTLQRRVKLWRATEGPSREVFFAQVHRPGELCQSDFTDLSGLGITIQGRRFDHLLYHFVLTYSNWEWCTVCFSESFESLAEGLQQALWNLGAVPAVHRTDRLSAAVTHLPDPEAFTERYKGLLAHYGLTAQKTQAGHPNENGDIEQRHYRIKQAVDQALMLRGSRDFDSREAYERFVRDLSRQLNFGRRDRLAEELEVMRPLPEAPQAVFKDVRGLRVDRGSLIHVDRNVYSVPSRLIGEKVDVRLYAEHLEVWYGQKKVEALPRLRGRGKSRINYRHVIDWLVRKPGAFANYRYREELFPTSRFRMAYDTLREQSTRSAAKQYLEILHLAAYESESAVDEALRQLLGGDEPLTVAAVRRLVASGRRIPPVTEVTVVPVDPSVFDELFSEPEAA